MKKNIITLLASTILLISCGSEKPTNVVNEYLKAEKNLDYAKCYQMLSGSDKESKTLKDFADEKSQEYGLLFTESVRKSMMFNVIGMNNNGDSATVEVKITMTDYSSMVGDLLGKAFSGIDSDAIANDIKGKMKNGSQKTTKTVTYNLVKENDEWKILLGFAKEKLIKDGDSLAMEKKYTEALEKYNSALAADSSDKEISEKINSINEKLDYFKKVSVYDFSARYYESYFSEEKTAGVKFKLKNNGDRELKKVQVTVCFKDNSGLVIHEEAFTPISEHSWTRNSDSLKPNHIWQIEEGHYYKADSVPSEWQTGAADIAVTDIEFK